MEYRRPAGAYPLRDPTMFGVDVLTEPQIDDIVLDFPIFPAVVAIVHTKPVIAILVPKLVAMATFLRPSISGMSSLDSLTPKTYP